MGMSLVQAFCATYENGSHIGPITAIFHVQGMAFARNGKIDVTAPFPLGGSLHVRSACTCLGCDGIRAIERGLAPEFVRRDTHTVCRYIHGLPLAAFREIS